MEAMMQSQHLLFPLLFLRGGEGWRWNKEEGPKRRRLSRAGYFLSYWVAADWSLCHHLAVRVVSESLVTPLSALFCQKASCISLMADPHLVFLAGH